LEESANLSAESYLRYLFLGRGVSWIPGHQAGEWVEWSLGLAQLRSFPLVPPHSNSSVMKGDKMKNGFKKVTKKRKNNGCEKN
jgi:hypothetical protein